MTIDKQPQTDFGLQLKSLIESNDTEIKNLPKRTPTKTPDTNTKDGRKDFIMEILESWKEARTYDDEHLYDDHMNWLRLHFNNGSFEFPDDYDWDTNSWLIGKLIAQVERYGGVVMDTDEGTIPYSQFPKNIPEKSRKRI